jgi:hypothetical protein
MLEVLVVPGGGTFIDRLKPGIVSNFGRDRSPTSSPLSRHVM